MKWAALLFCCNAAYAHRGAVVQLANFTNPPPLVTAPDGGVTGASIPVADSSFDVSWDDGDSDPTGRYFFYYLDHPPPTAMSTANVAATAIALPQPGIWAACDCIDGPLVVCPDAGVRYCPNDFVWDTSALAPGAYWLIAIDNDPPYYLYSVSESPVRIAHGGTPPPGALFVHPNGIGSADQSYMLEWVAAGDAPLTFDLAWGANVEPIASPRPIGASLAATDEGGGKFSYAWDTSSLAGGDVYVQLTVHDAQGRSSLTNSLNLRIYHPGAESGDLAAHPDMAMRAKSAASCDVGGGGAPTALFVGACLALLCWLLARRSVA
jgi:hypothetical protein